MDAQSNQASASKDEEVDLASGWNMSMHFESLALNPSIFLRRQKFIKVEWRW